MTNHIAHNRIVTVNESEVIEDYLKGSSVLSLSKKHNVCRQVITRIIRSKNVPVRDSREANLTRMAKLTSDERMALVRNAHSAIKDYSKGKVTFASNVQNGLNPINIGPGEAELLSLFGNKAIPQFAIGPYNIDMLVWGIAIEVKSNGGSAKARGKELAKVKYLLENGYKVCYIDFIGHSSISDGLIYIEHFINSIEKLPHNKNKYWLIRCGLQENPIARNNGWQQSVKPLPPEFVISIRERYLTG